MSSKPWLKYRRSTNYTVEFPTVPSLTIKPSEVDLFQERFNHDILELIYVRESQQWASLLSTGTPVVFTWFQGKRKQVWTGYVNHVNNQSSAQQERIMKIVCVGASYKLKARANRVWRNKTVTEVAAQIAKEFKFKFVGEPSSRRFEQLSMSGQTYWNWLQEYAAKIGYAFYVENTTLYLRPLPKLLKEAASDAAVLGLELPAPPARQKAWDRTLDSFVVQKGDYFDHTEAKYAIKTTSGVNPLTGKKLASSSSPAENRGQSTREKVRTPIFEDFSDEVVHSSSFSKNTSKDLAFAARFVITAKARGQGDPRIKPYAAVYLFNTGAETDGYWAVNKVHHMFNYETLYEVDTEITTDGIGKSTSAAFRKGTGLPAGTIDLDAVVVNQLSGRPSAPAKSVLVAKDISIKETQQGFAETNRFWRGE